MLTAEYQTSRNKSRTTARPAAGIAFHAGAVAQQGEVAAFAAGFALVAFHARLEDQVARGARRAAPGAA